MQHRTASISLGTSLSNWGLLAVVHLAVAVAAFGAEVDVPASQPNASLVTEYEQRYVALRPDDVDGHFALAEWCGENGLYDLAVRQTRYVLSRDSRRADARLLQTVALRKLAEQSRGDNPSVRSSPAAAGLLTPQDVQLLRFIELLDFQPDVPPAWRESVSLKFDRNLIADFLDSVRDVPEFNGRQNRQRFIALKPTQQLQVIRQYSGTKFLPRIQILSDPVVFRRFRAVAAVIERGCGGSGCHSGESPAPPFGLRSSVQHPEQSLYTQFLILDRVTLGRERLINRDRPADSLILQYGLPSRFGASSHPGQLKPLYPQGPDDVNYRMILEWIDMLRVPQPMTGIKLEGYPEPPPPGAHLTGGKETASRPAK